MIIDNIAKQTFSGAGVLQGSVNSEDITHILVTSNTAFQANDYLTVTHTPVNGQQDTVIGRTSCLALANISDLNYGESQSAQSRINALFPQTITGGSGGTVAADTDLAVFAFAVPVGDIKMGANMGRIDVMFESSQACKVSIARVVGLSTNDHVYKWSSVLPQQGSADNVEEIYLYTSSPVTDPTLLDLSLTIKTEHGENVANAQDLFGGSAVFGQVEFEGPKYVVLGWRAPDDLEKRVTYNVTGTSASNFQVIFKSVSRDFDRVRKAISHESYRLERSLANKSTSHARAIAASYKR